MNHMHSFVYLMEAELLKLRRSAALRLVWLLPLLYLFLEFLIFERPALGLRTLSPQFSNTFDTLQIKTLGAFWAGFFHPLMIAMLPALLFRPEHRYKLWRHLHAMPVSRRAFYLAKAFTLILLCAGMLTLVVLGLWAERQALSWFNPLLTFPFHGVQMLKLAGWLFLGSLPVLCIYLWVSDRINSLAVPIVFGLVGLILTIALSGQEVPQPWKRDLIPWVLPYFCAQRAIEDTLARQDVHVAGTPFAVEPNVLRLPSGRKVKTRQNIPDEVLFPPPPPTPRWMLGTFSLVAGITLLGLGVADAGRNRF